MTKERIRELEFFLERDGGVTRLAAEEMLGEIRHLRGALQTVAEYSRECYAAASDARSRADDIADEVAEVLK